MWVFGSWTGWVLREANADVTGLNHGLRADTAANGGFEAAKMLAWMFCRKSLWTKLPAVPDNERENTRRNYWIGQTWSACTDGSCKTQFDSIFVSDSVDLNVHIVEGWDDNDGGVETRQCKWSDGEIEACYLFDMARREGFAPQTGTHPTVTASASSAPLPVHPFVSLTYGGSRFAVWPKVWPRSNAVFEWPTTVVQPGSGVVGGSAKTIFRAAPQDKEVRDPRVPVPGAGTIVGERIEGWFDNTVNGESLEIYGCSALGFGNRHCYWTNLNTGAVTHDSS